MYVYIYNIHTQRIRFHPQAHHDVRPQGPSAKFRKQVIVPPLPRPREPLGATASQDLPLPLPLALPLRREGQNLPVTGNQ